MSSFTTIPLTASFNPGASSPDASKRQHSLNAIKPLNPQDSTTIILSPQPPPPLFPRRPLPPPPRGAFNHFIVNTAAVFFGVLAAMAVVVSVPLLLLRRADLFKNTSFMKDLKQMPVLLKNIVQIARTSEKQQFHKKIAWIGSISDELQQSGLKENIVKLNGYLGHSTKILDRANQNGLLDPRNVDRVGNSWTAKLLGFSNR